MPALTIHPASVKSLAYLDSLVDDNDKLIGITEQTTGAPLRRLLLSAIARHTRIGMPDTGDGFFTEMLEMLVVENLRGYGENTELAVSIMGERAEQAVLALSIVRYAYYG